MSSSLPDKIKKELIALLEKAESLNISIIHRNRPLTAQSIKVVEGEISKLSRSARRRLNYTKLLEGKYDGQN